MKQYMHEVVDCSILDNSKNNIYNLSAHPYVTGAVNWYESMQWKLKLYKDEEDLQEVTSKSNFQDMLLSEKKKRRCERVCAYFCREMREA